MPVLVNQHKFVQILRRNTWQFGNLAGSGAQYHHLTWAAIQTLFQCGIVLWVWSIEHYDGIRH